MREAKPGIPEQLRTLVSFDSLTLAERDKVIQEANRLGLSTTYAVTARGLKAWSVSLSATPAEIALLEAVLNEQEAQR